MKILILTISYPTQVTTRGLKKAPFVHEFAKAFQFRGNEVHVLTHGKIRKSQIIDDVHVHEFKAKKSLIEAIDSGLPEVKQNLRFYVDFFMYLSKFLIYSLLLTRKKLDVDLVVIHWIFPLGVHAWLLNRLRDKPYIMICYGAELIPFKENDHKLMRNLVSASLNSANLVASISQATQRTLTSIFSFQSKLIPDGIDTDSFSPENLSFEKNRTNEKFVVFFSGRMVERKGHIVLVKAALQILKSGRKDITFIIGGDGPLKKSLEMVSKDHLNDGIFFPGFIDEIELKTHLAMSDLYVLPSVQDGKGDVEGSATAALEAMSCGTPALISASGGNIGSIEENFGAWYFNPGDHDHLAKKIIELAKERDHLITQGELARQFVLKNYSWDVVYQQYKII